MHTWKKCILVTGKLFLLLIKHCRLAFLDMKYNTSHWRILLDMGMILETNMAHWHLMSAKLASIMQLASAFILRALVVKILVNYFPWFG
jgi:hypothetical protein